MPNENLDIEKIHELHPNISRAICDFYAEGCIIALMNNGHSPGVKLEVMEFLRNHSTSFGNKK